MEHIGWTTTSAPEICRSADAASAVRQTRAVAKRMTLGVMEQFKHPMTVIGSESLRVGSSPANRQFRRLDRRRFLSSVAGFSLGAASLGALSACQARAARPASKHLPRVGYFSGASAQDDQVFTAAVREGLEAFGYREGHTIQIEWRFADGDQNRWPVVARELVDLRPDVIVVSGLPVARPLMALTRTIPVVAVMPLALGVEQLISLGYIQSQVRPGGNLTGLMGTTPTLFGKRLDLLHEMVPGATRLATLRDSSVPDRSSPYPYPEWTGHVISLGVSRPEDLDDIFAQFQRERAELLTVAVGGGGSLLSYIRQIADQARRHGLPGTSDGPSFAKNGGLMSYAADFTALHRGAGRFVDKILKGAKPADLPVELPTAFNFIINKATANALGLTIPPAVLAQATEVLQ